jgi:hypothetical protein
VRKKEEREREGRGEERQERDGKGGRNMGEKGE